MTVAAPDPVGTFTTQVTSFSTGVVATPNGGAPPTLNWPSFDVTKSRDAASLKLQTLLVSGVHASTVTVRAFAPGGTKPSAHWSFADAEVQATGQQDGDGATQDYASFVFDPVSDPPTLDFDPTVAYPEVKAPATGDITFTGTDGVVGPLKLRVDAFQIVTPDGARANFGQMQVEKVVDAASPKLYAALRSGHPFSQVVIHHTSGDGSADTTYTLSDALVTQYSQGTGVSFDESLSLAYSRIITTAKLGDGSTASTCWNVTTYSAC